MQKGRYIVMIIVLVAIAGGAFALTSSMDKEPAKPASTGNTREEASTSQPENTAPGESNSTAAMITYSDSGFSPSKITVKSGTTVTIKNESSRSMQFDSDPHPAHTDNEELNVNNVSPGSSETFTVKRTGTFGYHNHLNPGDTGAIVVE